MPQHFRFHGYVNCSVLPHVCRCRHLQRRVRCCLLNVGYPRAKPSKDGDAKPPVQKRTRRRIAGLPAGVARVGAQHQPSFCCQPFSAVALLPCANAACADTPRNEQAKGGSNEERNRFRDVGRAARSRAAGGSLPGGLSRRRQGRRRAADRAAHERAAACAAGQLSRRRSPARRSRASRPASRIPSLRRRPTPTTISSSSRSRTSRRGPRSAPRPARSPARRPTPTSATPRTSRSA